MIFVSSSNVKSKRIKESVEELASSGFKNIELSGGTNYYEGFENDLLELREKYGLNFRCHNYFPPPIKSFVVNLSSDKENVLKNSRELINNAIDLSALFGAKEYGLHAGFRISPKVTDLGKKISNSSTLIPYDHALDTFIKEFSSLNKIAKDKGVDLYIENNVLSRKNYKSFNGENPFLLVNSQERDELQQKMNFNLLLDVAHLKVSCCSLELNFEQEMNHLIPLSNYLHISDNDGSRDSNEEFIEKSVLYNILKNNNLKDKTFTLEVYDGIDSVLRSYESLDKII